jgi:hypothetical protein
MTNSNRYSFAASRNNRLREKQAFKARLAWALREKQAFKARLAWALKNNLIIHPYTGYIKNINGMYSYDERKFGC